jgi:hypothetical protein
MSKAPQEKRLAPLPQDEPKLAQTDQGVPSLATKSTSRAIRLAGRGPQGLVGIVGRVSQDRRDLQSPSRVFMERTPNSVFMERLEIVPPSPYSTGCSMERWSITLTCNRRRIPMAPKPAINIHRSFLSLHSGRSKTAPRRTAAQRCRRRLVFLQQTD